MISMVDGEEALKNDARILHSAVCESPGESLIGLGVGKDAVVLGV